MIATPLWIRRPELVHLFACTAAGLSFAGQIAATVLRGSDGRVVLAVLLAGAGTAVSWRLPWTGLAVTSAASFAVTAVGNDPLAVWMTAVFVLFSVTFRGLPAPVATTLVAAFLLGAFMTVGGFRGGPVVGVAALFSAIAGGASGAALRIHRDRWWMLEERAARGVVEERLRIARDLHDVIGHQVAMLSMNLGIAEIGLPDDAEASRNALVAARSNARTVIAETQRILALLRRGDDTPDLRPPPSIDGLEGLFASFASIGLEVRPDIAVPAGAVEPSLGVTVFRVVQEALTNAYRHGEGEATVRVREQDRRLRVTVENRTARASRAPGTGGGLGLVGMRERVESSHGRLTIDDGQGRFRVDAEFGPVGEALG
ncbi:sensor histidine kinase [Actinoplanes rectilineatus]|uniref:sensor histidine kinase n=1 Tax=Actinoplanes rectilineatus TaxID=113571 RepID=UPI0005F2A90E|nr:histidine kinase [Actinoplanes rectilineatus]